jgi:hypothetical protein
MMKAKIWHITIELVTKKKLNSLLKVFSVKVLDLSNNQYQV